MALVRKSSPARNTLFEFDSPVLWTAAAWCFALICWMFTPDSVVYYFIPNGRYFSFSSMAFFTLCFLFFWIGLSIGTRFVRKHENRRILLSACWQNPASANKLLGRVMVVCAFMVLIGAACQLMHTVLILAGRAQEFDFEAVLTYRRVYGDSAIQGITIFKFIALPGFVLATIGSMVSEKCKMRGPTKKFRVLQLISLVIPGFSAMLGTRLIALMWVVPFCYLKLGFVYRLQNNPRPFKHLIKTAFIMIVVFCTLYSAGHYLRHYKRVLSGQTSVMTYARDAEGFYGYTFLTFLSYPFRTINNGLVVVDHFDHHSYLWRSLRWLYSGFGIEKLDPGDLIHGAKENMMLLDYVGLAYFGATNASLPGYLFIDLGWLALIMILLLGVFVGVFYHLWQKTALLGWVVMPIMITPLLDSWRTDVFFRSVTMVCIFSAIAAGLYVEKKCRSIWQRELNRIVWR